MEHALPKPIKLLYMIHANRMKIKIFNFIVSTEKNSKLDFSLGLKHKISFSIRHIILSVQDPENVESREAKVHPP